MADYGSSIWLATEHPAISFENTKVGQLKKKIWDMNEEEVDELLKERYEIPAPSEIGVADTYIQTTPRWKVVEKRKKNDVVLVPVGCTECHGMHTVSALDTFPSASLSWRESAARQPKTAVK